MIEEELKGIDIDGSGKITICAHQLHISIYYLEQEQTDAIEKIKNAFECIINNHFVREERIAKLTKRSKSTGLTAHVYRVLSEEVGEDWYVKITDRKGMFFFCRSFF